MPKLFVIADNICGSSTNFLLLGQEPKENDPGEFHTVITLAGGPIGPGERFAKEVELDHDIRHLQWIVPFKQRGRFHLRVLRWGNHNLLKESGRI